MRPSLPGFILTLATVCPLLGGPPFLTGDPDIAETKRIDFIPGWTTERRSGERLTALPVFELNYGLVPNVEVGYASGWLRAQPEVGPGRQGYGNSLVAAKWRLLEKEKNGLSMAVSPAFEFRNPGSRSVGKGLVADENTFMCDVRLDKDFGAVAVNVSVGRVFPSKSGGAWTYGLLVHKEITKTFSLGLETVGDADLPGHNRSLLNAGVRFAVGADSQLLVGIGRELHNHNEPRLTLRTYLGWQQTF